MGFNITDIGVDKPSGSPLITKENIFTFNQDLYSNTDIFYYLGTQLKSSPWVNPGTTEFLKVNKIQSNNSVILNAALPLVDNSPDTVFLFNETNSNVGAEFKFKEEFKVKQILLNGTNSSWILNGSSDNGNTFNNLTLTQSSNLGNGWYLYNVQDYNESYKLFRLTHGQQGVSKSLYCARMYGEYKVGDFAPSLEDNSLILNCRDLPGKIYLPDAKVNNYPEDYYFEVLNLYDNTFTITSIEHSTTNIVNNTNKPLSKGDKYIVIYNSENWNIFKVGATPNLGFKGALLSQDGLEPIVVEPGVSGEVLVRDDATSSGLNWVNLSINNQLFNPIITSSFVLTDSYNNRLLPIDSGSNNNIEITLGQNLQPGFQIIIFHYGQGKITINPNNQVYRARGNTVLNNNAAITLSFDLATNTWYGIGDLVQE